MTREYAIARAARFTRLSNESWVAVQVNLHGTTYYSYNRLADVSAPWIIIA